MSFWTTVKCDYFDGYKICPAHFRTTLSWRPAMREAKGYGWTRTKKYGIRCKKHQGVESKPYFWKEGHEA